MIRDLCSEVPIWIKWFAICAPKSRSESNDSQSVLRSPDLNQMIRNLCSEVPIWIKWFAICAPKSRSESNDSQSVLRSPDLNQMIRNLCSEVLIWIKWFTIHAPTSLNQLKPASMLQNLPNQHMLFFSTGVWCLQIKYPYFHSKDNINTNLWTYVTGLLLSSETLH